MKLNKHVMAMNLAAVIAFGAVAGIVAPSIASDDTIVAFAAETTSGDAKDTSGDPDKKAAEDDKKAESTKGAAVTLPKDAPAELKDVKLVYNGDGKTATYQEADKKAEKIVIPATFKNAAGDEIQITEIDPKAFDGVAAKSIDISAIPVTKLQAKLFSGAKKATSIKINGKNLKAKNIKKTFLKGAKKLKTLKVVASKKQFNKIKKALNAAAKKSGYKKGTKVKRVSK